MASEGGSVTKSLSSLRAFRKPIAPVSASVSVDTGSPTGQKRILFAMSSTDSDDSVVERNPKKKRRMMISSDDDESGANQGNTSKADDPEAEIAEARLDELKKVFPNMQDLELQDALKEAGWNVDLAVKALKSPQNGHDEISPLKVYPKKKKLNRVAKPVDSDSSDDGNGPRGGGGDFQVEDDDEGYHFEGKKVYDSDESDEETLYETTKDRTQVVKFLDSATKEELVCMPGSSNKKADLIMSLRPFPTWVDLVDKIRSKKLLSLDLLNAAKDTIKTQRDVARLMNRCEKISKSLAIAVEKLMREDEVGVDRCEGDLVDQPSIINSAMKLTHYQILGLNWLNLMRSSKLNGVLADEMGLGKTIQVIAFVALLLETHGDPGPHLIIVPSSTLDNWVREFSLWCPSIEVATYTGSQLERKMLRIRINQIMEGGSSQPYPPVIVTTYNIATSTPEDKNFMKKVPFSYVIFDEAHMLKNCFTQRFEHLMKIRGKRRILLTGTPMQNSLKELMSLLIFVMPKMFDSHRNQLLKTFSMYPKGADSDANENLSARSSYERDRIQQARRIMKPFFLRRLKRDVLRDLPEKTEEIIRISLHADQKKIYDDALRTIREKVAAARAQGMLMSSGGSSIMMQLRKLANHPLLWRHRYDDSQVKHLTKLLMKEPVNANSVHDYVLEELSHMSDFEIHTALGLYPRLRKYQLSDDDLCASGKMMKMDELLPEMKERGDKVLIFSQFVIVLNLLEAYMKIRGHKYVRFDGGTAREDRQDLIDQFNNDPKIFIFLLTTRAGGQGINLTSANTVILHDVDFNPHNDRQAEDRCHRVGQTRPVRVIRFIGQGTIEEGMYRMAQEKLKLEEDLGCRSSATAEEGDEESKVDSKDVFRLLHDYLQLDLDSGKD